MRIYGWCLIAMCLVGCALPHASRPCGARCDGEEDADVVLAIEDGGVGDGGSLDGEAGDSGAPLESSVADARQDAVEAAVVDASDASDAGSPADAARCGDSVCGAGESCETCPSDCRSGCLLSCISCEFDSQCGDGQRCFPRGCDGRRACRTMLTVLEPVHGCAEIDGTTCSMTPPYHPCASDVECGPRASCLPMGSIRVCRDRCSSGAQCPSFRTEGLVESCSGPEQRCFISCQRSAECPWGMVCLPFDGGHYGFCGSRP